MLKFISPNDLSQQILLRVTDILSHIHVPHISQVLSSHSKVFYRITLYDSKQSTLKIKHDNITILTFDFLILVNSFLSGVLFYSGQTSVHPAQEDV